MAMGGLGLSAVLAAMWFSAHGEDLHPGPHGIPWLLAVGIALLFLVLLLQIVRTGFLFHLKPQPACRQLAQPLLYAHGMNVLLPSMLGDLFEVWSVSKRIDQPVRRVLCVLVHRFTGTIAALLILAGVALGVHRPSLALPLVGAAIAGYLCIDYTTATWSCWVRIPGTRPFVAMRPYGVVSTLGHLLLAVAQHAIEALAIFCLAIGLGTPIAPSAAAGMVSIIEGVTYLPIPLAGAGANHWGASTVLGALGEAASGTAVLVAASHALQVLIGALAVAIGIAMPERGDATKPVAA